VGVDVGVGPGDGRDGDDPPQPLTVNQATTAMAVAMCRPAGMSMRTVHLKPPAVKTSENAEREWRLLHSDEKRGHGERLILEWQPSPTDELGKPMTYTHGHHESVLRSHRWRTVENSAAYLAPHLTSGTSVLDPRLPEEGEGSGSSSVPH
jgi:hypothetical protein